MKISVFYDHIKQAQMQSGGEISDYLDMLLAAGVNGIDIHLTDLLADEAFLLPELQKRNMQVSCIYETYDLGVETNDTHPEECALVDTAARLGVPTVLVIPGFFTEEEAAFIDSKDRELFAGSSMPEYIVAFSELPKVQCMAKRLTKLCAYAEAKKVLVTLEDYDNILSPTRESKMLMWFVNRVPGLMATFDTGNFITCKENSGELISKFGTRTIGHMHIKDRGVRKNGFASCIVGEGYLPIEQIVHRMVKSRYDGFYTIEHFDLENQKEGMVLSAMNLRKMLLGKGKK